MIKRELESSRGLQTTAEGKTLFSWRDPRVLALAFLVVFFVIYTALLRRLLAESMRESGYEFSGSPIGTMLRTMQTAGPAGPAS